MAENTLFTLSSAKKLTVICKRTIKKDGKGNLFADAQALIFNTSTGAYQVPLSGIGSLTRSTVDQATAEIRAAVNNDTQTLLANENQNTHNLISATNNELKSSVDKINTRINGISLNIVRVPNVYDIGDLGGERNCDGNNVVYGFKNSTASPSSLDMWRCAYLSLTIPQ